MYRYLVLLAIAAFLGGCNLLPQAQPAPIQMLLQPLQPTDQTEAPMIRQLQLAIERPLASAPLRGREIWYRNAGHDLHPFAQHVWAESLDLQLQQLLFNHLLQQEVAAVSLDQPGFNADYRLRIQLQGWYLDTESGQLDIQLNTQLLDAQGKLLGQLYWTRQETVDELSPAGMLQASQRAVQQWADAVSLALQQDWLSSPRIMTLEF